MAEQTQRDKALTVRLPDVMYELIKALAEKERRSLNNQVVWLLDQQLIRLLPGDTGE